MKPLLVLGSALGAVALACLYGLVQTGAIGNRRWMQVFAIACGSLTWASILCIAIPLARLSMRRGAAKNRIETQLRKERGDYVVRQSIPDRTLVVTIVAASVLLSAFFSVHPSPIWLRCTLYGISVMLGLHALRYIFTTVRFTPNEIRVQTLPYFKFVESYGDIREIGSLQGSLHVRFTDGRTLDIRPRAQDLVRITALLQMQMKRCSGRESRNPTDQNS